MYHHRRQPRLQFQHAPNTLPACHVALVSDGRSCQLLGILMVVGTSCSNTCRAWPGV